MSKKTNDAISRSDRVFVTAMAIVLATASAAIGASLTYRPSTDKVAVKPAVQVVAEAPKPATDAVMNQLLAEHKCLSEALYYEARGEGTGGQKAVAEVVFHRMNKGQYGHSICAVVYEGSDKPGCQFSFACDNIKDRVNSQYHWRIAREVAMAVTAGKIWFPQVGSATHYHAVYVRPKWAKTMEKVGRIGLHVFYRTYGGGWS